MSFIIMYAAIGFMFGTYLYALIKRLGLAPILIEALKNSDYYENMNLKDSEIEALAIAGIIILCICIWPFIMMKVVEK